MLLEFSCITISDYYMELFKKKSKNINWIAVVIKKTPYCTGKEGTVSQYEQRQLQLKLLPYYKLIMENAILIMSNSTADGPQQQMATLNL